MKKMLLLMLWCLCASFVQAQTPGVSIFYQQTSGDTRNYIEYIPGNLPIIISAPHGGVKLSGQTIGGVFYPDNDNSLPDRICGTNERDDNTDILVREIQKEIFQLTGCYAHVIINNLHRSKLDPNREVNEATCGNTNAKDHWNAFHNFIDQASASVEANWGKGLYIDLHGQSHGIPRIEAGYNITSSELNSADLNAANIINKSSIRNLVNNNLHNHSHEELIRGDHSLGEMFQNASGTFYASLGHPGCGSTNGYRTVPSATNNGGGSCDDTRPHSSAYFDGDFYNNRRHGSGNGTSDGTGGSGNIDGIMTEVNRRVRDLGIYNGRIYDSRPQTLVPFAKDYAAVLLNFINTHYNDFAMFSYLATTYTQTNPNPTPIIAGVSGGTFSSSTGLILNPATGKIDLANSPLGNHTVKYTVGTCGYFTFTRNISLVSDTSGDVTPPTAPTNLTASNTTETTTNLLWTASTDDMDVVAYDIYQNNAVIASISQLNYTVTGLTAGTTYQFKVIAKDLAGNESSESNVVSVTTNQNVIVNYCNSKSNNINYEYISRVQLVSIDNTSDAQFYSDFTSTTTNVTKNGQYTIKVTPTWTGTIYTEAYAVWIDYNQDGDFSDSGEQVWTQAATTATSVSGSFTIPTTATNGITRMRVSMKYNEIPTPCETFTYGEVEDYTLNIISPVPDTIAPIITLNGDSTVNVFIGDTYVDAGATAIDNIDGDLTSNIQVTGNVNTAIAGTYKLFYNVRDVIGNEATEVTRTVNVLTSVDTTAPVITLNGNEIINLTVGDTYTDLGATATDNVDGDITNAIVSTGTVDTATAGTYTIRYNVSDTAGNTAIEVIRTIVVNEISIGCINGITTFPYTESYENTLGAWTQDTTDDIDWTIDSNGTPSNGTGPANAIDGYYYIYVEASGNGTGYPNKKAILTSPCFNLTSLAKATFSFSYHMYGTDMGSLAVEASKDNGTTWDALWTQTGNQGNAWQTVNINLEAYVGNNVQLRFNRITGSTWKADVAIDNIRLIDEEIIPESCSGGVSTFPYTESYEDTLGHWTQSAANDVNWTVDTGGTFSHGTGPSNAVNGDFYIYVEASGNGVGYPNKRAIINSPCYDLTNANNATFSFSYHMFGSDDMGSIALEASNDNGVSWTSLWAETGNKGNQWLTVNVDLATYIGGGVQLRFNRITGNTWLADVAIDNLNLDTATTLQRNQTTTAKRTEKIVYDGDEPSFTKNYITIYPNPVRGSVLNIKLNYGAVNSYRIINMYGQEVTNGEETTQLNVSKLQSGMYFLEVYDGNNTIIKKFMKQ